MITRRSSLFLLAAAPWMGIAETADAATPTAFRDDDFAAAQRAGKSILVHITASWCTTCRAQKGVLNELENAPRFKHFVVFDVDFDAQKPVVSSFKARAQSTLIVFKGGSETGRLVGETDPAGIEALLTRAL